MLFLEPNCDQNFFDVIRYADDKGKYIDFYFDKDFMYLVEKALNHLFYSGCLTPELISGVDPDVHFCDVSTLLKLNSCEEIQVVRFNISSIANYEAAKYAADAFLEQFEKIKIHYGRGCEFGQYYSCC